MIDDRIYIDRGIDTGTAALLSNNMNNPLTAMAMMNGGMGMNGGMWNNPFVYIILLALFGRNGLWGGNGNECCCNNPQIQALSAQMSDNQNSNLLMDGIKGNASAVSTLAANLNCDFNTLNAAICNVQSAIQNVAAQTGFSAERVINAINTGDCGIITAVKDCCCNTQQSILKMGYEQQLATCNQTNTLTISTDKQQLISLVDTQYKECQAKIESIQKYREEMDKCKAILNQLKDEHKIIKDESVQTDLIRVS